METIERTYVDKSEWGNGPWLNEPDEVQFEDDVTKLPCLIVRGPSGALCGYVGVVEGHPFFGKDYDEVDAEAHGGLTFAAFCQEGAEETGICHVPAPGEPDRVWWLGFDCAHYMDYSPKYARYGAFGSKDVYRDMDYVKSECADLAKQLAAVA